LTTRSIAFYLPQYHPIHENDEWWGRGFTDWRNVASSRPRFRGHHQPQIPADLGFYDLREPETRARQADLARAYGIDGFCYYHYWFNGRRLLQRPLEEVVASGEPNFPFMICWANEPWSRRWDGSPHELLMDQDYSTGDDLAHIRALAPHLSDPRYITKDGKLVLAIYRTVDLPDPRRTTDTWREEAVRLGLGELHLCRIEGFHGSHADPRSLGFDAAIQFQPDSRSLPQRVNPGRAGRAARRILRPRSGYRLNNVYDYAAHVERAMSQTQVVYPRYLGVMPAWDNSSRRREWAMIFRGSTPETYEDWVYDSLGKIARAEAESDFLFVNAWNEWAEGAHLEPDLRFGHAYLEAHARALSRAAHDFAMRGD
jgi:lipopolysaccharide biosynthesis protein